MTDGQETHELRTKEGTRSVRVEVEDASPGELRYARVPGTTHLGVGTSDRNAINRLSYNVAIGGGILRRKLPDEK
jgi:hypothetical protein